jgi:hypothetical protein
MDPRQFLAQSGRLIIGARPEDARTAISRAYYAAYHVALHALQAMNAPAPKAAAAHGETPRLLGACTDKDIQLMARDLSDLFGRRVQADYQLEKPGPEETKQAALAFSMARKIIVKLDRLLSDPARLEAAGTEISAYARRVLRKPAP